MVGFTVKTRDPLSLLSFISFIIRLRFAGPQVPIKEGFFKLSLLKKYFGSNACG
jgi:hypothetical protein